MVIEAVTEKVTFQERCICGKGAGHPDILGEAFQAGKTASTKKLVCLKWMNGKRVGIAIRKVIGI